MPVETIACPECNGLGYIFVLIPVIKEENGTTTYHNKKERKSCPRCGGLGVVKTEIPDFIPEGLRELVNV